MSVELAILFVEHNKDLCRFVVLSAQRSRYQWLQDWQQHLIHDVLLVQFSFGMSV